VIGGRGKDGSGEGLASLVDRGIGCQHVGDGGCWSVAAGATRGATQEAEDIRLVGGQVGDRQRCGRLMLGIGA
jgi:hypothetical protein